MMIAPRCCLPFRLAPVWAVLLGLGLLMPLPAPALVKVDSAGVINHAIKYGIQNQKGGLAKVLGPNWMEGPDGTLLNIYSPYMMIATQASKKGITTWTPADITAVRKRMTRMLAQLQDVKTPQQVKFSVAMYGDSPEFARAYKAVIEGEGRGQTVRLDPVRVIPDAIATDSVRGTYYEGINAYYFNFKDLENLETFRLIIRSPSGDEKVFTIDNNRIY